jgi:hypothetical protein
MSTRCAALDLGTQMPFLELVLGRGVKTGVGGDRMACLAATRGPACKVCGSCWLLLPLEAPHEEKSTLCSVICVVDTVPYPPGLLTPPAAPALKRLRGSKSCGYTHAVVI